VYFLRIVSVDGKTNPAQQLPALVMSCMASMLVVTNIHQKHCPSRHQSCPRSCCQLPFRQATARVHTLAVDLLHRPLLATPVLDASTVITTTRDQTYLPERSSSGTGSAISTMPPNGKPIMQVGEMTLP
jgi:hypothetical protein